MANLFRWLLRIVGFAFVLAALYPFYFGLQRLDRREYVSAVLAVAVGWLVARAGIEFVRPDSAE